MTPAGTPPLAQAVTGTGFRGELYLPARPGERLPALVVCNSSAGVCDIRERFYARALAGWGLAVLVVDSFGPRGVVETMTDQSRVLDCDLEADAFAAYDHLAADGRFDPERIAVCGVSKGGLAALNTGLAARRAWFSRPGSDFAAHIALAPPAHLRQRDLRTDGRPCCFLLAGCDDYAGLEPAQDLAARLRAAGADLSLAVYPGAHHAWERTGAPLWLARAENYSRSRLLVEDDGDLTDPRTGERLDMETFFRRRAEYRTLGGHAGGGSAALKARTVRDLVTFLSAKAGFPLLPHP